MKKLFKKLKELKTKIDYVFTAYKIYRVCELVYNFVIWIGW